MGSVYRNFPKLIKIKQCNRIKISYKYKYTRKSSLTHHVLELLIANLEITANVGLFFWALLNRTLSRCWRILLVIGDSKRWQTDVWLSEDHGSGSHNSIRRRSKCYFGTLLEHSTKTTVGQFAPTTALYRVPVSESFQFAVKHMTVRCRIVWPARVKCIVLGKKYETGSLGTCAAFVGCLSIMRLGLTWGRCEVAIMWSEIRWQDHSWGVRDSDSAPTFGMLLSVSYHNSW